MPATLVAGSFKVSLSAVPEETFDVPGAGDNVATGPVASSVIVRIWLAETFVYVCTLPFGQRTSSELTVVAVPKPKCWIKLF